MRFALILAILFIAGCGSNNSTSVQPTITSQTSGIQNQVNSSVIKAWSSATSGLDLSNASILDQVFSGTVTIGTTVCSAQMVITDNDVPQRLAIQQTSILSFQNIDSQSGDKAQATCEAVAGTVYEIQISNGTLEVCPDGKSCYLLK